MYIPKLYVAAKKFINSTYLFKTKEVKINTRSDKSIIILSFIINFIIVIFKIIYFITYSFKKIKSIISRT